MRASTLVPGLLLLAGCAAAAFEADRAADLDALLRRHGDPAVQVAALVVDLDDGEVLFEHQGDLLLRPASTMKVLTTAAVCRRAPDADVVTALVASANGDVTLLGGGDPFLSTDDLHGLVRQLQQRGLRSASGGILVVDPLRPAPRFGEGWMWDDEPAAFMPPISAAAVDGGCVTVAMTGAGPAGLRVRLLPTAGDLEVSVAGGNGRPAVTRGRYDQAHRVAVAGTLAPRASARERISVPDPAAFTGHVVALALQEAGALRGDATIRVAEAAPAAPPAARAELRRSLAEVVQRTAKDSDNLGAELLLRLLPSLADGAPALPHPPGDAARDGLAAIAADIVELGLDPSAFRLADGSGVSHYNLISGRLLVAELADMHRRGGRAFAVFRDSLPIAGEDGTLARRMRGTAAQGRVRAKTGTISGVSNLAGYVDTASGRHLAFAILIQNFVGSSAGWRELQDEFCSELAGR